MIFGLIVSFLAFHMPPQQSLEQFVDMRLKAIDRVRQGSEDAAEGVAPTLSFRSEHDGSSSYSIISFHRIFRLGGGEYNSRTWLARRISLIPENNSVGISYASSDRCPNLTRVLALASTLEMPSIIIRGLPYSTDQSASHPNIVLDDFHYILKAPAEFSSNQSVADLEVSGDSASPLGHWAILAEQALAPCWEADTPPAR